MVNINTNRFFGTRVYRNKRSNQNARLSTTRRCFDFDGVDDYIHTTLQITSGTSFKWTGRFNKTSANLGYFFDGRSASSGTNKGYFGSISTTISFRQQGTGTITTTSTFNDGEWHFVEFEQSGTTATISVDGVIEATGTHSNGTITAGNMKIGAGSLFPSGASSFFDGKLDDIKIYENGDLKAWYEMNETSGNIAYDSTGNRNDGFIYTNSSGVDATVTGGVTIVDKAIDFDGTTGYLTVANSTDYSASDWSVFAEVYFDDDASDAVMSQQDGSGTGRNILLRDQSTDKFATSIGGTTLYFSTLSNATINTRLKICLVKSGTSLTLYHDGGTETKTVTMESATGNFIIGANKAYGNLLNGQIRNLRFYTDALTPTEVASETNKSTPSSHADLLYEWRGDYYMGTSSTPTLIYDVAYDNSVVYDGNNATPTGGVTIVDNSVNFDGSTGYLTIPNTTDYSGSNWSVSMKMNFDTLPTSPNNDILLSQEDGTGSGSGWVLINVTGATKEWRTGLTGSPTSFTGITAPASGTDYNVTLTKSGTTVTLYVNGESESKTLTMVSATGDFLRGTNKLFGPFIDCKLHYFRFYTDNLSSEEVASETALTSRSTHADLLYEYRGGNYAGLATAPTSIYDVAGATYSTYFAER